ncbi:hypothetical protein PV10_08663 [Exophiala mesophila]|uniref:ethanolamine kinase n=1 Tax=Exophiala mesophila TaxID=212818 RepID=A0A0D1WJL9_EXOME|nr:uncharacterized protein PV10_08663 [Exophiala mesophila]KIV89050.1 hypothetical protein PV10_08663 [Exophiala mesophila]
MVSTTTNSNGHSPQLLHIDASFNPQDSESSALDLVYRIQSKWRDAPGKIEIIKFTDGITNNLLKISKHIPGLTSTEIDEDSVLLRAYGNNTDIIIDRDREATSHALCAQFGLAPTLLARFNNGLLYRYIIGKVCTPKDLIREPVWRAVAERLGEWHSRLPIHAVASKSTVQNGSNGTNGSHNPALNGVNGQSALLSRKPVPNCWSVMQKWVSALPQDTLKKKARKQILQKELDRSFKDLDNQRGPGADGFVFGHCDLLSANVIMLPLDAHDSQSDSNLRVSFIDYEYATPCPASFDIANHFAEWGGYDCDYNMLPTRSVRRGFIQQYLASYNAHSDKPVPENMHQILFDEIDRWRGMPGLYWGIWALIQATISQIDFDYASYAEVRLDEYFAWRAEESGSRAQEGEEMPLRERRWAEE